MDLSGKPLIAKELLEKLQFAIRFLEFFLETITKFNGTEFIKRQSVDNFLKPVLAEIFRRTNIRLRDLWIGREMIPSAYTPSALIKTLIDVKRLGEITFYTSLYIELSIEFKRKPVEVVGTFYVNEKGEVMQTNIWVRATPYEWIEWIEEIFKKVLLELIILLVKKILTGDP